LEGVDDLHRCAVEPAGHVTGGWGRGGRPVIGGGPVDGGTAGGQVVRSRWPDLEFRFVHKLERSRSYHKGMMFVKLQNQ
jgi:hypothetical protein